MLLANEPFSPYILMLALVFVGWVFSFFLKARSRAVQTSLQYYPELSIVLKYWDSISFKSKTGSFQKVLAWVWDCRFPQTFLKGKGTPGLLGAKDKIQDF